MRQQGLTTLALAAALALALMGTAAHAQGVCTEVASGLRSPVGSAITPHGRVLVSETGTMAPHSGRISMIEPNGVRRTLIDGLPSGIADVGGPSGPTGISLRGRTLYVAVGVGDVGVMGRNAAGMLVRGSAVPNPAGPSSPLYSSVLAIHFSAEVERNTVGFTMTTADQQRIALGQTVTLSNGGADQVTVRRVVDLPNYVLRPHPTVVGNIQMSNPYQLLLRDDKVFVTDGGRNLVWSVDLAAASAAPLSEFGPIPNPLFGTVPSGPFLEAVPTGVAGYGDQLLVTLFRGAPFPTGVSAVQKVDPTSGSQTALLGGLTTAIDVLPLGGKDSGGLLVLQYSAAGPFFAGPGQVLRFDTPAQAPSVVASCLSLPTSMAYSARAGRLYVTEEGGRVVSIPLAP